MYNVGESGRAADAHVYTHSTSLADLILPHTRRKRARTVRERPWIALGVGLH